MSDALTPVPREAGTREAGTRDAATQAATRDAATGAAGTRNRAADDTGALYTSTLANRVGYRIGVASIVVGGLVAAITGPLHLEKGSWLAAYLVLIGGVALCVLSRQHRYLRMAPASPRQAWVLLVLWISGNTLVIAGALASLALVTDAGGLALCAALALALWQTRGAADSRGAAGSRGAPDSRGARAGWRAWALRLWFLALVVSIPIGLTLTHLRSVS